MEVHFTAIYHLEAEIITRGEGRSAVAASAYRSGSEMKNEYDGVVHSYTRKRGVVYQEVMLPANAPAEWMDREKLWNAVETAEKAKDSRLAREFNTALPVELSMEEWIPMLREFIQRNFVDLGMAADFAIHNVDPNNPHVHIMLTLRPLDEKGKWQAKTQKEYLCVKDGEERGFTAEEFKTVQNEGWEKQYLYKIGKKKIYMTPSTAEEQGISNQRTSKYPKCTKYGRQNPITEQWNSEEQLKLWRKAWEMTVNDALEKANHPERVDCRSFKDRGIDEIPTIHEGTAARMIEKKGGISERCELNRQIRRDNALLRKAKAEVAEIRDALRKAKEKITERVKSVAEIAQTLEELWCALVRNDYSTKEIRSMVAKNQKTADTLEVRRFNYDKCSKEIKSISAQRKALIKERDSLMLIHFQRRKELTDQINALSARYQGLLEERSELLAAMDCVNGASDLKMVDQTIDNSKKEVRRGASMLRRQEIDRQSMEKQYQAERKLVSPKNYDAVMLERSYLREEMCPVLAGSVRDEQGKYNFLRLKRSKSDVNKMLNEKTIKERKRPEKVQEVERAARRNDIEL